MLDEEIVGFWGTNSLVRWPLEILAKTSLPEDAKEFLTRVGLPSGADWPVRFDLPLEEMRRSGADQRYIVIGYDIQSPFCLDLRNGGRVVFIGAHGKEQFVNSNVRRFAECLLLFQKYRLTVRAMDREDDIMRLISETEATMRATDSIAFGNPENCWPVVVEQMREGSQ